MLQEVISIQELEVSKIRKHPQSRVSEKPDNKYSAQQKEILEAQISLAEKYFEYHFTSLRGLSLSLSHQDHKSSPCLGTGEESVLFIPIIIRTEWYVNAKQMQH